MSFRIELSRRNEKANSILWIYFLLGNSLESNLELFIHSDGQSGQSS